MLNSIMLSKTGCFTGSVAAALLVLSLVPLNMGGCSGDTLSTGIGNTLGNMNRGSGQTASSQNNSGLMGAMSASGDKNLQQASAVAGLGKALAMDDQTEDEMGQAVAVTLTSQYGLVNNDTLALYVRLVGLTLADSSARPDGHFVFGVLNSNEVNAFSGPNGYVLVTRGAMQKMQDESELAGVLAHEIAHVVNHDGFNAVKQSNVLSAGLSVASTADQKVAQFRNVANAGVDLIIKKGYSKGQELKADEDAVKLLTVAGYDPEGYLRFLQRLQQSASAQGGVMSTHPGIAERITRVQDQIANGSAVVGGATLKDRFQKNVKF